MRRVGIFAGAMLALALLSGGGRAASTLTFEAAADRSGQAHVYLGATPVLTLAGSGSLARTQDLARRMNAFAEEGVKAADFAVRKEGRRTRVITVRGARLITIDRPLARIYGVSPSALASRWLARLAAPFKHPYLSIQPAVVPLGETRATPVVGNIVGRLRITSDSPVARGTWDAAGRAVQIAGQEVGRATLTVADAKSAIEIPVRVAKYAVQVDGAVAATVTGSPASPSAVEAAVSAAVQSAIHPEPGASCEILTDTGAVAALYPGRSTQVTATISAGGPDYLPYRARPAVTVVNQSMELAPVSVLMVSNSPEKLTESGLWYEGLLRDRQSARLLYHHVNMTGASALLSVELWNLGSQPAQVHLLAGVAGPSYDELWVGHRAMSEFLRNRLHNAGWVITVPPGTAMTVLSHTMPRGSVVSGVAEIRALGAANLSVRVILNPASTATGMRPVQSYQASPLLGAFQYPDPTRVVRARYEVGGNWTFVTIGDQPAIGIQNGDRLAGSYGVMYEVQLELSNKSSAPAPTGIMMESAGGAARGCLLIDGKPAETPVLRHNDEATVASYTLAPGETRTVTIVTLPQAGSNYPVRLVARPLS